MVVSDILHALLIFGSAFVLEDIAVLGAALLVVNSMISLPWAAGSSFAGIWLGDLGLYALAFHYGRPVLEKQWFKRLMGKKLDFARSETWFRDHGVAAVVLSRAIPGTRLPTYLAAGLLRVPALRFVAATAVACVVWVALLFAVSYHIGMMVISEFNMFRSEAGKLAACVVVAATLAWVMAGVLHRAMNTNLKRLLRWEFWPAPIFYIPVAFKYVSLAIRYRSFSLPTLANPGMDTGGIIGESKYQTLAELAEACPEFVPETRLVRFESIAQQEFELLTVARELQYPVVLKPDVGQRGFGFRIVHSDGDVRDYVARFSRDTLVQRYVPGPLEAGVFYYRLPQESAGHLFAITEKVFPAIRGDGGSTIEQLIRKDPRASLVAETYLQRFAADRNKVLAEGDRLRLVEAGNHCQGAVFLDGGRMWSAALERRIDEISRSIRGFYVGRYDIRFESEEALRNGIGFQIIELNGASSEATNIYDPQNSLRSAYSTLFRQWEIIFAIADENRKRGLRLTPVSEVWRNWVRYQQRAAVQSLSD